MEEPICSTYLAVLCRRCGKFLLPYQINEETRICYDCEDVGNNINPLTEMEVQQVWQKFKA